MLKSGMRSDGGTLSTRKRDIRGGFHPPNTARSERIPDNPGAERTFHRITTVRLEPSREQYALLKLRDAQAAQRMNRHSLALYAQRNGWRAPEDSPKDSVTKHDRLTRDELSSAIYVACEARVGSDWKRIGKRIACAVQMPVYRKGNLPIDSGARGKPGACGIEIIRTSDAGYAARLHLTAKYAVGENPDGWEIIPIGRRTERDERRAELMAQFADGKLEVAGGSIRFTRDKTLLLLAFAVKRVVAAPGDRVATVTEFEDGRLLVRSDFATLDLSSKLNAFRRKKLDFDGIRRRFCRRAMRSKGSSRRLSEKLDTFGFDRWSATETHRWSREIIEWALAQHCGSIVIAQLTGADWPAHALRSKLAYKAEEAGLTLTAPSLEQEPTERATKSAIGKKARRAKKLGDAMREINHQLRGDDDESR